MTQEIARSTRSAELAEALRHHKSILAGMIEDLGYPAVLEMARRTEAEIQQLMHEAFDLPTLARIRAAMIEHWKLSRGEYDPLVSNTCLIGGLCATPNDELAELLDIYGPQPIREESGYLLRRLLHQLNQWLKRAVPEIRQRQLDADRQKGCDQTLRESGVTLSIMLTTQLEGYLVFGVSEMAERGRTWLGGLPGITEAYLSEIESLVEGAGLTLAA